MHLFDFSLKINGFKIDRAQKALQKIQGITEADYEDYLDKQKSTIVDFHLKNNPFYQEFAKGTDMTNWENIPVMTKRDLQRPLIERLSKGFSSKSIYINKTSGSSGDPFIFAKDKFCHALTWAETKDRFGWFNIDFNTSKQARFFGIPLDKKGYYKERIKDIFSNRFRFSIFNLNDEALEKVFEKFKKSKFDYINGYTSSIVQFAKFLKNKNVVLKDVCKTLKVCITTAEMLFDNDKILLEKQLGVPVVNEYGASELGLIAFQNPDNLWQVNSETLFVEILGANNEILPYGEEGRIVITALYNQAHPFIRYDIGDIGQLSKISTPKKPVLEKLIGRTNDIAILPSGKRAAGLTFYYITKSIIEDDGNVKEFIIEQLSISHFNIKYISTKSLSEEKKATIKKEMEGYLEPGLDISFERQTTLDRSNRGKLKQFISLV